MSWTPIDDKVREQSAMGRFEIICERYLSGNNRDREIILSFFNEEEKQVFLKACGLYHLFSDQSFYNHTKAAIGKQLYEELHGKTKEGLWQSQS